MSAVKDGLAKAWADHLHGETGMPSFAHRHDGRTVPPFCVVLVKRLNPTVPGDDVHLAEVRVVVVSDIAISEADDQQDRMGAVFAALEATPRRGHDVGNGVRLCGFVVDEVEQVNGSSDDGRKVYSDVFSIRAGVAAL